MLANSQLDPLGTNFSEILIKIPKFHSWKYIWKYYLRNGGHFVQGPHWGRVTHICISELPIIGSDNGLSPGRRHAIIWTNAGILLIRTLGTNFSENLIEILTFSFTKIRLNVSSAKRRPFCLGLNVLSHGKITADTSAFQAICIFNWNILTVTRPCHLQLGLLGEYKIFNRTNFLYLGTEKNSCTEEKKIYARYWNSSILSI